MMETLGPYFEELSRELTTLSHHLGDLKSADRSLTSWNSSFGAVTLAMKAISQTYYDHPVKRVPLKSPVKDEPVPVEEAHTKKRKSIAPPPGSTKKKKVAPKNDAWTKIYKGVLRDLPKKYQTKGENLKRLEIVWRTVENKTIIEKGAVLSDIVKVCGCSVLQANECLGTLIKLKLVQRHKAKQSLLYQSVPR